MMTGILFDLALAHSDMNEHIAFFLCLATALLVVPALAATISAFAFPTGIIGTTLAVTGGLTFVDGILFLIAEG